MTADHSPTIAFTNGAFTDIDKDTSVEWIAGHADGVQLVAFTADELDHAIEGWAARCNDQQLPIVALHAPGVDIGRPTSQLVARLADAIPDVPIVAHPDVMGDLPAWRHLGSRLLVETMDPGKATGSTIAQIDAILHQLPAAGVCVDVSHSLSAGGPALPVAMARRWGSRIGLLHVGCQRGRDRTIQRLPDIDITVHVAVAGILPGVPTAVEGHWDRAEHLRIRDALTAA